MAKLFFPLSNPFTALLAIFATYAIPFAVRPIGAIILGAYADRHGRKKALLGPATNAPRLPPLLISLRL